MENNINQKFDLQDKLDISSPEKFIKNTDHFNSLMMRYRCAIREIRTKLEVLNDEFSIKYNRKSHFLHQKPHQDSPEHL